MPRDKPIVARICVYVKECMKEGFVIRNGDKYLLKPCVCEIIIYGVQLFHEPIVLVYLIESTLEALPNLNFKGYGFFFLSLMSN